MIKLMPKNATLLMCILILHVCQTKSQENLNIIEKYLESAVGIEKNKVTIKKEFLYAKDTLPDSYLYKNTTREFQWDKIRQSLTLLESIQEEPGSWAVLQNYKDIHGKPQPVKNFHKNDYNQLCDSLGVAQYQSAPLYAATDSTTPLLYGRDGSLVKVINKDGNFIKIATVYFKGDWKVPQKYVKLLDDGVVFRKAIFVDRTNQNIATLEKVNSTWLVRSMTKATTGLHKPPYEYETPTGIFVVQEKKDKMIYNKDGSDELAGFAPYASRFSGGAHIHGVPVNGPLDAGLVEDSPILGTTPHSHECVRTITSHAKFIYDWGTIDDTIVFVID
jgi:hypothetical protein